MIPSAMAFRESFPFLVQLSRNGVMDAGLDDQLGERQRIQVAQIGSGVCLNVGIEEVAHVRLVGLDVQLLARMLFDRGAGVAVKLHLLLQGRDFGIGVTCLSEILGDVRISAHERGHGLVERNPQRLGFGERVRIAGIAAEVMEILLHLARRRHRLAKIAERFAGGIELFLPLHQPILELDVVVPSVALVDVQLVGAIDRDGLLHIPEQLLEIHDVAVILVVAVEPVGAADGLEQVVIVQLVVEIDVGAARRVEAGQELAHHDQQLEIGRLLDEPPLGLIFIGFRGLAAFQDVLRVGVELVSLVAVGRFAGDRVVVRLVGCDDAAILAEGRVLEEPVIMAGVIDAGRHEDGRAPVVVQARLEAEVLDDAGDDALLALARAHQLFHFRPALAEDGALKIVQRL